ncbi:hypothetical protein [Ensifer canadensis]|uniref:hypothetical protein n=1 Tax=Ensifer canadensis TaxID=555315 RepID=UPI0035E3F16C
MPAAIGAAKAPAMPGYGEARRKRAAGVARRTSRLARHEVADLFRCSIKTLERWRLAGIGPKVSRFYEGARPLYLGSHLREVMNAAVEPRPGERG